MGMLPVSIWAILKLLSQFWQHSFLLESAFSEKGGGSHDVAAMVALPT